MKRRTTRFPKLLFAAFALAALAAAPARAGMIATDEAAPAAERRLEVERRLVELGVAPEEARERTKALTEQEAIAVAQRLDTLPAGGALSNQDLLIIILIVLLVAIVI